MLYLFCGTDQAKSRSSYEKLVTSLTEKHPEALLVRLDELSFNEEEFKSLVYGQGLFSRRLIVTGNTLCSDKERAVFIEDNIEVLKNSPNVFILIEEELSDTLITLFEKYAEKVVRSDRLVKEKEKWNPYRLTDALVARDRKTAWIEYERSLSEVSPEEIFWKISWQVKLLSLAKYTKNFKEAQASEYPYGKAQKALRNFKDEEIEQLSEKIVNTYHASRRGSDMSIALEKLVLNI